MDLVSYTTYVVDELYTVYLDRFFTKLFMTILFSLWEKYNKAPGTDGFPAELFKTRCKELVRACASLFTKYGQRKVYPKIGTSVYSDLS